MYDMKPLKVKLSITLDEDVVETIRKLAEEDDRSVSQYINLILKTHLAKNVKSKQHAALPAPGRAVFLASTYKSPSHDKKDTIFLHFRLSS